MKKKQKPIKNIKQLVTAACLREKGKPEVNQAQGQQWLNHMVDVMIEHDGAFLAFMLYVFNRARK